MSWSWEMGEFRDCDGGGSLRDCLADRGRESRAESMEGVVMRRTMLLERVSRQVGR